MVFEKPKFSQESSPEEQELNSSKRYTLSEIDDLLMHQYTKGFSYDDYDEMRESNVIGHLDNYITYKESFAQNNKVTIPSFYKIFEELTLLDCCRDETPSALTQMRKQLIDRAYDRITGYSPQVADMYLGVLSKLSGDRHEYSYPKIEEFVNDYFTEEQLDLLTRRFSSDEIERNKAQFYDEFLRKEVDETFLQDTSRKREEVIAEVKNKHWDDGFWSVKYRELINNVNETLQGRRLADQIRGKEMADEKKALREKLLEEMFEENTGDSQEEGGTPPSIVPPVDEFHQPDMHELDRLNEGESAPVLWEIIPAQVYGKLFRSRVLPVWNQEMSRWEGNTPKDKSQLSDVQFFDGDSSEEGNYKMVGNIQPNTWVEVRQQYTHSVCDIKVPEQSGGSIHFKEDSNGDQYIMVTGTQDIVSVEVHFAYNENKKLKGDPNLVKNDFSKDKFTDETLAFLENLKETIPEHDVVGRALAIKKYTKTRLTYDNIESLNEKYRNSPYGYSGAQDREKIGNCGTGNTHFSSLSWRLGIIVRNVVGSMVKSKNRHTGNAVITPVGHSWSEVWDPVAEEWIVIDATPKGDPMMDESENEQGDEVSIPGDEDGDDALRKQIEDLQGLRDELTHRLEELSFTPEELEIAKAGGVDKYVARDILSKMETANNLCFADGNRILDVLNMLFKSVIDSRLKPKTSNSALATRRKGGRKMVLPTRVLTDLTEGKVDSVAYKRRIEKMVNDESVKKSVVLSFVADKSGSMHSRYPMKVYDSESQKVVEKEYQLWEIQLLVEYLALEALHLMGDKLDRSDIQKGAELDVLSSSYSFGGTNRNTLEDEDGNSVDVVCDKEESSSLNLIEKIGLYKNLSDVGGGNSDAKALGIIYKNALERKKELDAKGIVDDRLQIVFAFSDGGMSSKSEVQEMLRRLRDIGVVVVGLGITETASEVSVVYDVDNESDVDDLLSNQGYSVDEEDELSIVDGGTRRHTLGGMNVDEMLADDKLIYSEVITSLEDLVYVVGKYIAVQSAKLLGPNDKEKFKKRIKQLIEKFNI